MSVLLCTVYVCVFARSGRGEELIRYYFISPTNEHRKEWSEVGNAAPRGEEGDRRI